MEKLPVDLIDEILLRSPAKTVERWVAACSTCAAVVRRTSFYRDFYRRALYIQQPRALFVERLLDSRSWIFRSVSILKQDPPVLLSTSTTFPLPHSNKNLKFMNHSSGLICSVFGAIPIIINPSNGQYRVLPVIFNGEKEEVRSFIGFDSLSGFKVVAIKKDACKVLTVDTMLWKGVCTPQHKPATNSVCINGTIYYAAYEKASRIVLISFNIQTEVFQMQKIPQRPKLGQIFCEKTISVDGKVGICFVGGGDTHVVRILEDQDENLWSERVVEIPYIIQNDILQYSPLCFEGYTSYGDIVFSQNVESTKIIYYSNGENDVIKKHVYQGCSLSLVFLDYVESTIFL